MLAMLAEICYAAMLQGASKPDGKSQCTFDEFAGPSRGLRKSETGMK